MEVGIEANGSNNGAENGKNNGVINGAGNGDNDGADNENDGGNVRQDSDDLLRIGSGRLCKSDLVELQRCDIAQVCVLAAANNPSNCEGRCSCKTLRR
ncbi:hyphally regulated cell wall protein 3-like [Rhagoletis pomonella]|uniref:hyphally regulated cell wall protein 3-like n=1 Tax=Rhagoletis pomonella TaxID=28610 RepID=UPI00177C60A3|nr:hyphally regulated cell wall protein 3-like [Rhagoletis pomonella]